MKIENPTSGPKQWKQLFDASRKHLDRVLLVIDSPHFYYPAELGNVVLSTGTIVFAFNEHDIRTASTIILINLWGLAKAYKETRRRVFDDLATACHSQIAILEGWCTKCHQKSDEIHKSVPPTRNGLPSKTHEAD